MGGQQNKKEYKVKWLPWDAYRECENKRNKALTRRAEKVYFLFFFVQVSFGGGKEAAREVYLLTIWLFIYILCEV